MTYVHLSKKKIFISVFLLNKLHMFYEIMVLDVGPQSSILQGVPQYRM